MEQHPVYHTLNQRPTLAWIDRDLLSFAVCAAGVFYVFFGRLPGLVVFVVAASTAAWLTRKDPLLPLMLLKSLGQGRIYDPVEPDTTRFSIHE